MVAGVQSGDILHRINGEEITTMREYSIRLQSMKPGQQAELTVYRKNPSGGICGRRIRCTDKTKIERQKKKCVLLMNYTKATESAEFICVNRNSQR